MAPTGITASAPLEENVPTTLKAQCSPAFDFVGDQASTDLQAERQRRKARLAAALRIMQQQGLVHYVSGHASVRDPIDLKTFWVYPLGSACSLAKASDMIQLDWNSQIVSGGHPNKQRISRASAIIDISVYRSRPEVNSVCHTHTPYGTAFSTLGVPFEYLTHDSCSFYREVTIYPAYGGLVLEEDEGRRIAEALGSSRTCILQNHGLLTVGSCVDTALIWMIMLERECQVQMLALSASAALGGKKPIPVHKDEAEYTYGITGTEETGLMFAEPYFEAMEAECGDFYKQ